MSDHSSSSSGGKELRARAGRALHRVGRGGKPLRFTSRDQYIDDLEILLPIFDKGGGAEESMQQSNADRGGASEQKREVGRIGQHRQGRRA